LPGMAQGAALAVSPAQPESGQANFKTPSGNISCTLTWQPNATEVQCWVLSTACFNKEVGANLAAAWILFLGRPVRSCPGDFVPAHRVLAYGHRIRHGPLVCKSMESGLWCDRGVHGFVLSRQQQRTW
jgi:hypothetical protein